MAKRITGQTEKSRFFISKDSFTSVCTSQTYLFCYIYVCINVFQLAIFFIYFVSDVFYVFIYLILIYSFIYLFMVMCRIVGRICVTNS